MPEQIGFRFENTPEPPPASPQDAGEAVRKFEIKPDIRTCGVCGSEEVPCIGGKCQNCGGWGEKSPAAGSRSGEDDPDYEKPPTH